MCKVFFQAAAKLFASVAIFVGDRRLVFGQVKRSGAILLSRQGLRHWERWMVPKVPLFKRCRGLAIAHRPSRRYHRPPIVGGVYRIGSREIGLHLASLEPCDSLLPWDALLTGGSDSSWVFRMGNKSAQSAFPHRR
jgi:hypothetical protein